MGNKDVIFILCHVKNKHIFHTIHKSFRYSFMDIADIFFTLQMLGALSIQRDSKNGERKKNTLLLFVIYLEFTCFPAV